MTFTIEHITKKNQNIFAELFFEQSGEHLDVKIDVVDFYLWLDRKDRLDWGTKEGETGRYKNGSQFWRLATDETKNMNLTDYINDNEIIFQHFEN